MGIHIQQKDVIIGNGKPLNNIIKYPGQIYIDLDSPINLYMAVKNNQWKQILTDSPDNKDWGITINGNNEQPVLPNDKSLINFNTNETQYFNIVRQGGNSLKVTIDLYQLEIAIMECAYKVEEVLDVISNRWVASETGDIDIIMDKIADIALPNGLGSGASSLVIPMDANDIKTAFENVFGSDIFKNKSE